MSVAILGAGAFGTAMGIALAQGGVPVALWSRDAAQASDMARTRRNTRRLPDADLPEALTPTSDLGLAAQAHTVLLTLPAQQLADFLGRHAALFDGHALVSCAKGIDLASGRGPVAMIAGLCPKASAAVLTGPSFAADIARGLPTALTLATSDATEGARLQAELSVPTLRLYLSDDPVGAELGGALKNVIAIAAGVVIGAGFGESARAALVTRGFAEISRLALAMGARVETLQGLSGLGDLVLTCTSSQSRNFRYGLALGRGEGFDAGTTVEGRATALAVLQVGHRHAVDLPVAAMVAGLIDGRTTVREAAEILLTRPLKRE